MEGTASNCFWEGFQDCVVLVFGEPRTAIYAHMDSIGFSTGYDKELIKVGGPRLIDGMQLVGSDSRGEIETELMLIESVEGETSVQYVLDREIDRGTLLTFKLISEKRTNTFNRHIWTIALVFGMH